MIYIYYWHPFLDEEEEAYKHEASHPDDSVRLPVKCGRLNTVNYSFLKFAKISRLSDTFLWLENSINRGQ